MVLETYGFSSSISFITLVSVALSNVGKHLYLITGN